MRPGPLVRVELADESDALYERVTTDGAGDIADTLVDGRRPSAPELDLNAPFFTRQVRIVTANAGHIDPERIEDYLAVGGYEASQQSGNVDDSAGCGGRGHAQRACAVAAEPAFPRGVKWGLVARAVGDQKYVICNGDEGDPGAYMDRASWKATRIACWRAWRSPRTRSAPVRASSTCAANTP